MSRLLHILTNARIITICDGFPVINDNGSLMKELRALANHIDVIAAYVRSFDSGDVIPSVSCSLGCPLLYDHNKTVVEKEGWASNG